jgi:hypothetical protein
MPVDGKVRGLGAACKSMVVSSVFVNVYLGTARKSVCMFLVGGIPCEVVYCKALASCHQQVSILQVHVWARMSGVSSGSW